MCLDVQTSCLVFAETVKFFIIYENCIVHFCKLLMPFLLVSPCQRWLRRHQTFFETTTNDLKVKCFARDNLRSFYAMLFSATVQTTKCFGNDDYKMLVFKVLVKKRGKERERDKERKKERERER